MRFSLLCLLLASGAHAADVLPAPGFSFAPLRALKTGLMGPPAKAGDVLSSYHMIAQAGKDSLFGYTDDSVSAAEAAAYWTAVLKASGIQTGPSTFADGMYRIPYKTADGRVIRDFLADSRQFSRDEAALRSNMTLAANALEKAGRNVVAAHVLKVDELLSTYSILYLTQPSELPEHETRLRLLKTGGSGIDLDVYRGAGVDVIQAPETWMMVYVGPEVGYAALTAGTPEELEADSSRRRRELEDEGKKLIAERPEPSGAALYYFQ